MNRNRVDKYLEWNDSDWDEIQSAKVNYQEVLEGIPIGEIQRFLRKKKLENIENGN